MDSSRTNVRIDDMPTAETTPSKSLPQKDAPNHRLMDHTQEDAHPLLRNKYVIMEPLGRGAQGTVFKAKDMEGHIVAIKMFDLSDSTTVTDWKAFELLKREVTTLQQLKTNGIPQFIEFIEGTPTSYLVESYIDAKSIDDLIRDGVRLTEAQIWDILDQAFTILAYLHDQVNPIIHRDIKPSNLLVDMTQDPIRLWLVDFGTVTAARHKTQASTVAGTFGYAAPEQFYGRAEPSSDIYGLGMTIIHLLSGVSPNKMEMDGLTLQYEKYLPSNLSSSLKIILSKMVKANPKERFQSISEIRQYIKMNINSEIKNTLISENKPLNKFTKTVLILFAIISFMLIALRKIVFAMLIILGTILSFIFFKLDSSKKR